MKRRFPKILAIAMVVVLLAVMLPMTVAAAPPSPKGCVTVMAFFGTQEFVDNGAWYPTSTALPFLGRGQLDQLVNAFGFFPEIRARVFDSNWHLVKSYAFLGKLTGPSVAELTFWDLPYGTYHMELIVVNGSDPARQPTNGVDFYKAGYNGCELKGCKWVVGSLDGFTSLNLASAELKVNRPWSGLLVSLVTLPSAN